LTENSNSPIHIFFHGGYWHSFSSQDFAFVAEGLVRNGILAVIVNYSLCPKVKLNEIVRQARDSVAWVYRNARNFDANPNRISVSGHSAGGHLTGMLLSTEWTKEYGLAQNLIKFFMPISGIFDLKPFPFSWLQPKLNLSSLDVKLNSPLNLKPMDLSPFFIAVGSKESKEFKRQSFEYYKFLKNHGVPAKYALIKGKNHFNVIHDFLGNGGLLCNHIYKRSI